MLGEKVRKSNVGEIELQIFVFKKVGEIGPRLYCTERFTDLYKLNLAKLAYGGKVLGSC